jgi:hypothetical protein
MAKVRDDRAGGNAREAENPAAQRTAEALRRVLDERDARIAELAAAGFPGPLACMRSVTAARAEAARVVAARRAVEPASVPAELAHLSPSALRMFVDDDRPTDLRQQAKLHFAALRVLAIDAQLEELAIRRDLDDLHAMAGGFVDDGSRRAFFALAVVQALEVALAEPRRAARSRGDVLERIAGLVAAARKDGQTPARADVAAWVVAKGGRRQRAIEAAAGLLGAGWSERSLAAVLARAGLVDPKRQGAARKRPKQRATARRRVLQK